MSLGIQLKKQASIAKDQYQGLDRNFEFHRKLLIKQKIKNILSQIYSAVINLVFSNTEILKN